MLCEHGKRQSNVLSSYTLCWNETDHYYTEGRGNFGQLVIVNCWPLPSADCGQLAATQAAEQRTQVIYAAS